MIRETTTPYWYGVLGLSSVVSATADLRAKCFNGEIAYDEAAVLSGLPSLRFTS